MNREEDILQSKMVIWYSSQYGRTHDKCLFHINNKAKNAIEGNRMKSMGVKTGVSDLALVTSSGTIYIEVKTPTGTQSKDQKEFQQQVESLGQKYFVVRSLEECQIIIKNIYNKNSN